MTKQKKSEREGFALRLPFPLSKSALNKHVQSDPPDEKQGEEEKHDQTEKKRTGGLRLSLTAPALYYVPRTGIEC